MNYVIYKITKNYASFSPKNLAKTELKRNIIIFRNLVRLFIKCS